MRKQVRRSSWRRAAGAAAVLAALGTAGSQISTRASTFASPIQHVVVIYQENHSFDETLGYWCNTFSPARCDGFTGAVRLKDGVVVLMKQSPDVVPEVDHSVSSQKKAIDAGRMDGWDQIEGCTLDDGYGCLTYYVPGQIPNLTHLAAHFAVSDRTFSMADSPSWGGHLYAVAATTDGFTGENPVADPSIRPGPGWGCDSNKQTYWVNSSKQALFEPSCVPDPSLHIANGGAYEATPVRYVPTIMDRLKSARLSWRLYTADSSQSEYVWATCPSFAECLDTPQQRNLVPTDQVISDANAGTLPNFSLVLPGGGAAAGASQHNGTSMVTGDSWIGKVVSAVENGPDWSSTAIFITYDDCGCFYDHVAPGTNPDGSHQGPRMPLVIVSPYVRAGHTDSTVATTLSILAFTEHAFGLSPLSSNDAKAYNYSGSFNYSQTPLAPVPMVQIAPPRGEVVMPPLDDPT